MLKDAQEILTVLNNNNCEAYIVGGFVRDFLLKRPPKDVDITTSATLDDLKDFSQVLIFVMGIITLQ